MNGSPQYNESVRTMVGVFCTLFNDISIERLTTSGEVDSTIQVPITFSDKAKWYRKLREELTTKPKNIQRLLPRIGIDLVGVRYDSSLKGISTIRHMNEVPLLDSSSSSSSNSNHYKQRRLSYMRVPYTYDFEVSIAAKTMEDSLLIIEQILPFFKPELSVTINDHKPLNIDTDVKIVIKDTTKESTRLDNFDTSDLIVWTLGFEAHGYLYSPVSARGVILTSIVDIFDDTDVDTAQRAANITASTIAETAFDINDTDTYTNIVTEYDYFPNEISSSSSSSSGA